MDKRSPSLPIVPGRPAKSSPNTASRHLCAMGTGEVVHVICYRSLLTPSMSLSSWCRVLRESSMQWKPPSRTSAFVTHAAGRSSSVSRLSRRQLLKSRGGHSCPRSRRAPRSRCWRPGISPVVVLLYLNTDLATDIFQLPLLLSRSSRPRVPSCPRRTLCAPSLNISKRMCRADYTALDVRAVSKELEKWFPRPSEYSRYIGQTKQTRKSTRAIWYGNEHFDCILMCWPAGSMSSIYCHDKSSCWVTSSRHCSRGPVHAAAARQKVLEAEKNNPAGAVGHCGRLQW